MNAAQYSNLLGHVHAIRSIAEQLDPGGELDGWVERVVRLHNGTVGGERVVGRGPSTDAATHALKDKLLAALSPEPPGSTTEANDQGGRDGEA